jgi:sugar lactone lactonase YvrE
MSKELHLEIIASDNNICGEGPIWDAENQRLLWTDIESEIVYEFVPSTAKKSILSRGLKVSGIGLNRTGELIFCGRGNGSGLHLWQKQNDFRTVVSLYENVKLSFNDMIIDPQGRAYVGALHWGANGLEKTGELFLVNCDGSLRIVEEGIEMANGLGFSPGNRTLYFTDTSARKIYAYDVNAKTGDLSKKRLFVHVPNDEGMPDGLTVDAEGFVWSAQWYGAQVVRYDPEGQVERRVKLPVTQVTNVTFGGKDLNELYISSAAGGWKGPYAPPGFDFEAGNWGGLLYRVKMDICGKREHVGNFKNAKVT